MHLEKNIKIIEKINPELADAIMNTPPAADIQIANSKIGVPSIRIGNTLLHSLYDPFKEAEGWVRHYKDKVERASSVIVFGFGLGYHIMELCKITEVDIIVFEPRLDILRTAFELIDLTFIISRVRFITGNEIPEVNKCFIILEHRPSVNLNPGYFEYVHSRLKVLQRFKRGLKIMVVGPIYGGSLPVAGYCATALKELGHTVDFVDCSAYRDTFFGIDKITTNKMHRNELKVMFGDFVSESIVARCAEFKPDLIFALAQAPLGENSLKKIRDNKIPTAFWFVEDFRVMEYWQRIAHLYDYFFTIQRGQFLERLKRIGVRNPHYLPLAASPEVHKKIELTNDEIGIYGSGISFVGAGYYNRRKFFEGLLDFDFKIWGNEWDINSPLCKYIQRSGERIDTEEVVKIFNATKININLHSSTYHNGINPHGDFVNPRTFEIAACGGFQLVDYRSELPEFFRIGEEMICFEDLNDLRHKIRYYLDNPEERNEIALRARERVLREHTYEHRMKEMLDFIFKSGYEPPSWIYGKKDVESLIEAAGNDTELGQYLKQFIDSGEIDIRDIIEKINSGDGSLSRIERVFLLMDQMMEHYTVKD